MTPLLANPFIDPDALPPCASEAAASSAPQSGAAATHSNPDLSIPSEPAPQPAEAHPAPASAGLLETDCISEIFFYARKLMKEPVGFILNEREFLDAIEDAPIFLRTGTL